MKTNDIQAKFSASLYPEAFELLMASYREKVFRLAWSMLRNETQAQDATQEVFLKIWKALPGIRSRDALSSWVYSITRNTCLNEIKRHSNRRAVSLQEPEMEAAADQIESLHTTDQQAGSEMDVDVMLTKLPEKYRQVISLFYLEQKRYEEVAELLAVPIGTVKTLLFRARKCLLEKGTRQSHPALENLSPTAREERIPRLRVSSLPLGLRFVGSQF